MKKRDIPKCLSCSKCCRIPWVNDVRPGENVPEAFTEESQHPGWRRMKKKPDGSCLALDDLTNACTIYANRPLGCSDFARGSIGCETALKWGKDTE